jgi:hypothetical protein
MYFNAERTRQSIQASPIAQPREPVLPKAVEGFAIGWLVGKVLKRAGQQLAEPWDTYPVGS